jgi:hypothetical protein
MHAIFFIVLLFICAYKAWVTSPPCPHPLPYHPICTQFFNGHFQSAEAADAKPIACQGARGMTVKYLYKYTIKKYLKGYFENNPKSF